jgi:hypothetical protein
MVASNDFANLEGTNFIVSAKCSAFRVQTFRLKSRACSLKKIKSMLLEQFLENMVRHLVALSGN